MEVTSLLVSLAALLISLTALWLTRFKKGLIKMTRPTIIFIGPDGADGTPMKIFIRTLLYSTSDRGQYIEHMFIKLRKDKQIQNFNIWVYGDPNNLTRGSGLFIGKHGLAVNHHFLLPGDTKRADFIAGDYELEIYVGLVNCSPRQIYAQPLAINDLQSLALSLDGAGVYFDWLPDRQIYHSHIDRRPARASIMKELSLEDIQRS